MSLEEQPLNSPKAPEPSSEPVTPGGPGPLQVRRNWIVIGAMAFVLILMIWVGVYHADKTLGVRTSSDLATGNVKGKLAPDFELQEVSTGKPVHLSDYRGKAVLLNFWATWCPPCKEEIPWFVDLQKQYGPDGLVVLGVAMDDAGQQQIAKFAQGMGINYPILLGTDKVGDEYGGVDALPTTFYIGRDGKIVQRAFGLHTHHEVEESIKAALNTQPSNVAEAGVAAPGAAR